jgi:hypothetical protein
MMRQTSILLKTTRLQAFHGHHEDFYHGSAMNQAANNKFAASNNQGLTLHTLCSQDRIPDFGVSFPS